MVEHITKTNENDNTIKNNNKIAKWSYEELMNESSHIHWSSINIAYLP
jgi:hypothetical protein